MRRPFTVMSTSIGAAGLSSSNRSWWTVWKCQTRLPVFASRQTIELV